MVIVTSGQDFKLRTFSVQLKASIETVYIFVEHNGGDEILRLTNVKRVTISRKIQEQVKHSLFINYIFLLDE